LTIGQLFVEELQSPAAARLGSARREGFDHRQQKPQAAFFRDPQQFPVFQITPSHVGSGYDLVLTQRAKAGS
jgi:hypothetical protein